MQGCNKHKRNDIVNNYRRPVMAQHPFLCNCRRTDRVWISLVPERERERGFFLFCQSSDDKSLSVSLSSTLCHIIALSRIPAINGRDYSNDNSFDRSCCSFALRRAWATFNAGRGPLAVSPPRSNPEINASGLHSLFEKSRERTHVSALGLPLSFPPPPPTLL